MDCKEQLGRWYENYEKLVGRPPRVFRVRKEFVEKYRLELKKTGDVSFKGVPVVEVLPP